MFILIFVWKFCTYMDIAVVTLMVFVLYKIGCIDTPSWVNGHGYDCNSYGKRWCQDGSAKPGKEWTLGAKYNYPENNCCVCGKKQDVDTSMFRLIFR